MRIMNDNTGFEYASKAVAERIPGPAVEGIEDEWLAEHSLQ